MSDIYNAHNQARRAAVYEIGLAQDEWSINQAIRAVEDILYDTQVDWNKQLDQNRQWDLVGMGYIADYLDRKDMRIDYMNLKDYLPKGYQVKYRHADLMEANMDIRTAINALNEGYQASLGAAINDTITGFIKGDATMLGELVADARKFIQSRGV